MGHSSFQVLSLSATQGRSIAVEVERPQFETIQQGFVRDEQRPAGTDNLKAQHRGGMLQIHQVHLFRPQALGDRGPEPKRGCSSREKGDIDILPPLPKDPKR